MTMKLKTKDDSHCFICGCPCRRGYFGWTDSASLVIKNEGTEIEIRLCSQDYHGLTGYYPSGIYFGRAPKKPTYKEIMVAYRAHPRQKYELGKLYDKVYALEERLDKADEEKEKEANEAANKKQAKGQALTTKWSCRCGGWWFGLAAAIIAVAAIIVALIVGP